MGEEGGGAGQDQSSAALAFSLFFGVRRLDAALPSSLVKNRTAEGPALSKTKDERVGHPCAAFFVSAHLSRDVYPFRGSLRISVCSEQREWVMKRRTVGADTTK